MTKSEQMMRSQLRPGLLPLSLVGWGILRGWWWLGVLLAVLVELPKFVKKRKDFQAADYLRAFTLSWLLLVVVGGVLWLQDVEREQFELLVECLPLFFLPVILCQLFSETTHYPLYTSTYLSHLRHKSEVKRGTLMKTWRMNFGYLYLFTVLVSASWNLESLEEKGMLVVLAAIIAWRFLFFSSEAKLFNKRWGGQVVYMLVLSLAVASGFGSIKLYQWLEAGKWINYFIEDSPIETMTKIGKLGEVKQDPTIHWRIINPSHKPSSLLRDRVFNRYINGDWYHAPVTGLSRDLDFQDFNRFPVDGGFIHVSDPTLSIKEVQAQKLSPLRIRGKGAQRTLLPISNTSVYMRNDSVEGLEFNSIGSVVATNPINGVIDYTIHSHSDPNADVLEMPPSQKEDLQLPSNLDETLKNFIADYAVIKGESAVLSGQVIKQVFKEDFTYSLQGRIGGLQPIKVFLESVKAGHCEYYATAGCLLLRHLGYPARYTTGYVVTEYDQEDEEWVLRGLHAHAWVRVWDAEAHMWKDIDFTPPGGLDFSETFPSLIQEVQDNIRKWREDFIIWRSENEGGWVLTLLPWFLVLLLLVVFGRNLFKARNSGGAVSQVDHVMHSFSKFLNVTPRQSSETYREWLETTLLSGNDKKDLGEALDQIIYGQGRELEDLKRTLKKIKKESRKRLDS